MTFEEFRQNYPIRLNKQQEAVVRETEGPVLLLAVPGSGKTTVLVARLGYMLLARGIDPASVLTMTYTVAATRDMKARFSSFFGEEAAEGVEFRTINGVAQRVLNLYARLSGKTAFTLLSDEKERSALLREAWKKVKKDFPAESDIQEFGTHVTYAKNMLFGKEELSSVGEEFPALFEAYSSLLREKRQMDYDDQLTAAYKILGSVPQILSFFQDRYRYICVDEAQDTSKVQHAIIRLLASRDRNLFMVGDEDQSIYGFRAAYPEALLQFEADYPGAKVLLMEENFRSDAKIVAVSDRFIQKNLFRHKKTMKASRPAVNEVREVCLTGRRQQTAWLLKMAADLQQETAVLYRDHESALPLIDRLEREGIPYRVRQGDLSFFTHRVVQDILNVFRFACDPYDTELFLQIYYKLKLYLQKPLAEQACFAAKKAGIPVLDAVTGLRSAGSFLIMNARALRTHLENLKHESGEKAVYRVVHYMGYGDYLERAGLSDSKISILEALGAPTHTPMELMERLAGLQELLQTKVPDKSAKLILSTIHSSKGLEYDTVYLMDVYDGRFPEKPFPAGNRKAGTAEAEEARKAYEEERRLFYVGMTRAKNRLFILTYRDLPSVFTGEIFRPAADQRKEQGRLPGTGGPETGRKHRKAGTGGEGREILPRETAGGCRTGRPDFPEDGSPRAAQKAPCSWLKEKPKTQVSAETQQYWMRSHPIGSAVFHQKFGSGRVIGYEKNAVTVRFETEIRKLSLKAALAAGQFEDRR